jgi:hypothetical protein
MPRGKVKVLLRQKRKKKKKPKKTLASKGQGPWFKWFTLPEFNPYYCQRIN